MPLFKKKNYIYSFFIILSYLSHQKYTLSIYVFKIQIHFSRIDHCFLIINGTNLLITIIYIYLIVVDKKEKLREVFLFYPL